MFIDRKLNLSPLIEKKSCFLFGPRQTGKSSLVGQEFANARLFNLLDSDTYRNLNSRPSLLREQLVGYEGPVVIDEIQMLPERLWRSDFR